jgi:hypothetical protein
LLTTREFYAIKKQAKYHSIGFKLNSFQVITLEINQLLHYDVFLYDKRPNVSL